MRARVTLVRTLALAVSIAWSDGLGAQTTVPDPRGRWRSSIADLLSRRATLSVMPGVGLVTGSPTRTGVGATIAWTSDADAGVAASIALGLMGARIGNRGFTRSGIDGRLEWRGDGVRAWIGAGAAAAAGAGPGNVFSMELGGRAGGLRLDIRTSWLRGDSVSYRDTLTSPVPRSAGGLPGNARYTDAEITAARAFGRVAAQAVFGARFGESGDVFGNAVTPQRQPPDRWASANITVPVRGRVALVAGGGWQPERREIAQRGGAFTSVSLRFDLRDTRAASNVIPPQPVTPSMLSAEPIGDRRYRLRIVIEAQRSVELQGDLTDWRPVALRPAGSQENLWEISVASGPGVYHVNLRVDGGDWIVPAGLPRVPDGFGGSAGLLTLK
jgi:hypothetical protein